MIKQHIILFTSQGCAPCKIELNNLSKYRKLQAFPKEENRFIIVDIQSPEHMMWTELYRPLSTPELKIVDTINFKVKKTFSGVGCIDSAWKYLDIPATGPTIEFSKIPVVMPSIEDTTVKEAEQTSQPEL